MILSCRKVKDLKAVKRIWKKDKKGGSLSCLILLLKAIVIMTSLILT